MTERDPAAVSEHPGPEEVAAYLSGGLGTEAREGMEAHLAQCRACRRQVTSAQALLRSRPRPMRWVVAAAAAAVAIALVGPWSLGGGRKTGPSEDIERARPAGTEAGIVAVRPADGDTVAATDVVFTWRARAQDLLYRLSVTDGRGQTVWTADTRDTSIVVPPNVRLIPGTRYYWYVDGGGATAASWTTGTRVLVVAP